MTFGNFAYLSVSFYLFLFSVLITLTKWVLPASQVSMLPYTNIILSLGDFMYPSNWLNLCVFLGSSPQQSASTVRLVILHFQFVILICF